MFFDDFYKSLCSLDVNLVNGFFRMVLAMLLGAVVGAERKNRGQVAGIRTFSLISMGACMSMLLSIYVPQEYLGLKNGDPGRIAAQVITGIGFLGGGAMIQQKGAIRGLTTAAGIWITAIIGMGVGVGMYILSIGTTALILVVLVLFELYERRCSVGQENKVINIKIHGIIQSVEPYRKALDEEGIHLSRYYIEQNFDNDSTDLNLIVLIHTRRDMMPVLKILRNLNRTRSINLSNQIDQ